MVAVTKSSPQSVQPPPVPPGIDPGVALYLQQFAQWCSSQFALKQSGNNAQDGILLQAINPPPGVAPAVFKLQIQQNATFVTTPIPLGSGQP